MIFQIFQQAWGEGNEYMGTGDFKVACTANQHLKQRVKSQRQGGCFLSPTLNAIMK